MKDIKDEFKTVGLSNEVFMSIEDYWGKMCSFFSSG